MSQIKKIWAREILDSRGNPTVEVEVTTKDGGFGRAAVPSGASTGVNEATELRDGDKKRYNGKGVLKAVKNVNEKIGPELIKSKLDVTAQKDIDELMIKLDGTKNKSKLGANAILGVSMAVAKAAANESNKPLYKHLAKLAGKKGEFILPVPLFNVLNGGEHSSNNIDMQEYKIGPVGATSFSEALRMGSETYHALAKLLKKDGYATTLGDEGGFAPDFRTTGNSVGKDIKDPNELPLAYIVQAIKDAGYVPATSGKGAIAIFLDPATSSFDYSNGGERDIKEGATKDGYRKYELRWSQPDKKEEDRTITTQQLIKIFEKWVDKYPVISIEDPVSEFDWEGMKLINEKLGDRVQLLGDDLFVTNPEIIKKGIKDKIANSVLIKLNQIGTVSETIEAIKLAQKANWTTILSHRSGETEDSFIADLVVAVDGQQIKTGAPARSERLAKYNQLIRIEEELGDKAVYPGTKIFYNLKVKPGKK